MERLGHLGGNGQCICQRQRAPLQPVFKRPALDALYGDEIRAVGFADFVDVPDPPRRVFACGSIKSGVKLLYLTRRFSAMRHFILSLLLLSSAPLTAGDPQGFACWTAKTLKGFEQKLAPKIDPRKVATEQLASYAGHSLVVVHREGSGEAEVHESLADIFVVQSGQATLLVGGTVIGGKSAGPGEIRGSGIKGGEKRQLAEGVMVYIPAGMPHQVTLEKGRQLTYVIVKVKAE